MPCTECGTSARDKHAGVVGGELRYDEDGTARYVCLSCTIEMLKKETNDET